MSHLTTSTLTLTAGVVLALAACGSTSGPTGAGQPAGGASSASVPATTASATPSSAPSATPSSAPSAPSATPSSAPSAAPSSAPSAAPSSAPSAANVTIAIKDFKYVVPASVSPGATIMIKNEDSANHTVTSKQGGFDVKVNGSGTAMLTAPSTPGSYPFVCTFHANMTGTLVVK